MKGVSETEREESSDVSSDLPRTYIRHPVHPYPSIVPLGEDLSNHPLQLLPRPTILPPPIAPDIAADLLLELLPQLVLLGPRREGEEPEHVLVKLGE